MSGSSVVSEKKKICCKCGKDVTHAKRMKDATTGRYWCDACFESDPARAAHANDVLCPECHKYVPPLAVTKAGDRYICGACYKKLSEGGRSPAAAAGKSSKLKLILAVTVLLIGIALIASYTLTM
jgi:formylmethanofuran dehydrogenase subunit E